MDLRALIFDLDGVIADTLTPHYYSWVRLAEEEGIPFDREIYQGMKGLHRRQCMQVFLGGRSVNEATFDDYLRRKNRYFHKLLDAFTPADTAPGVAELIDEGRAAGLKIGLGSSSQNAARVLDKLGLLPKFDVVGDGNSVRRHKPAPDIFLWVAERLHVSADQAVVFEDSEAGIESAKAGGFPVVGIGESAVGADWRVSSLSGVTLDRLCHELGRLRSV